MSEDYNESNENEIQFDSDYFRSKANHFSLHDDLNLLKSLESLNNCILTKSDKTYRQLDTIENQVKIKSVQVVNLINEFQMLADSQFIENRVYDEGVQCHSTKDETTNKTCQSNESHFISLIQESLQTSFKFIDENIKIVSRPNATLNDSDDEDNNDYLKDILSVAIKNSPFNRSPLPYIIGTEDFLNESVFGDVVDNFDDITKNRFEYLSDSDEDSNKFQNDNKSDSKSLSESVDNIHYISIVQPTFKRDIGTLNTDIETEKKFEEIPDNEDDLFSIVSSLDKFDSFMPNDTNEIKHTIKSSIRDNIQDIQDNNSSDENVFDTKHQKAIDNDNPLRPSTNPLALSSKLLDELNAKQNKLAKSLDQQNLSQSLSKTKSINSLYSDSSSVNFEKSSTKNNFEPSLSSKSTPSVPANSMKQPVVSTINAQDNDVHDNDGDDIDIFKALKDHTKTHDDLFGPDNSDDDDYSVFKKKKSNDDLFSNMKKGESFSIKTVINEHKRIIPLGPILLSSSDDEQIDPLNVSQMQKESKPIQPPASSISVSTRSQSSSIPDTDSKNSVKNVSKDEKKNKSIFDWDSDSDDLFQALSKEKSRPKNLKAYNEEHKEKQIRTKITKDFLFSDSDNEDDLFTKKLNTNSKLKLPISSSDSNKSDLINKLKPKLLSCDDSDNDSSPSKTTTPELNEAKVIVSTDFKALSTTAKNTENVFSSADKSLNNEFNDSDPSKIVNRFHNSTKQLLESDSEEDLFSLVKQQQEEETSKNDSKDYIKNEDSFINMNIKPAKETQKRLSFSDDDDYTLFSNSKSQVLDSHLLSKDILNISKNKEDIKKPLIYDIDNDPLFASILNKKNVTDSKSEHNKDKLFQIDDRKELGSSINGNKTVDEQSNSEAVKSFQKVVKPKSILISDESDDDNLFSNSYLLSKTKITEPASSLDDSSILKVKKSENLTEELSETIEENKFLPFTPQVLDNANLKSRAAIVASRKKHYPRKIRKKFLPDECENKS